MSGEAELSVMIVGLHLVGVCFAAVLLFALRSPAEPPTGADGGLNDGGWGNGPPRPSGPPDAPPGGFALPLLDAEPARARLRDHRRLGDFGRPRERRPTREPGRDPARVGGSAQLRSSSGTSCTIWTGEKLAG